MRKEKKYQVRKKDKYRPPDVLPQQNSFDVTKTFNNNNYSKGIFNTGKDNDRNYMGSITRKVYMKNANGEVITMEETQNFLNVAHGVSVMMQTPNQYRSGKKK